MSEKLGAKFLDALFLLSIVTGAIGVVISIWSVTILGLKIFWTSMVVFVTTVIIYGVTYYNEEEGDK